MLKQHYETTFGIFDHRATTLKGQRPWSSIAHLPTNSPGKYYDVEYLIDKYHENGIWDILHISFDMYASLPPHKMLEIDAKCHKLKVKKEQFEDAEFTREKRLAMAEFSKAGLGKGP